MWWILVSAHLETTRQSHRRAPVLQLTLTNDSCENQSREKYDIFSRRPEGFGVSFVYVMTFSH